MGNKYYKGSRLGGSPFVFICFDDDTFETTSLRHICRHSPDGFEWGYGGSGPADLALSILCDAVGKEDANKFYMDFKWDFISKFPKESFRISEGDVKKWIKDKKEVVG